MKISKIEALELLKKERVKNISIINFITDYRVNRIERVGDSLLIRGTSDHDWVFFSSSSEHELIKLIAMLTPQDEYFSVIEDWMMPYIVKKKEVLWKLSCVKLYFPDELDAAEPRNTIAELTGDMAEYIFNNSKYKDYVSVEYIVDRIEKGTALGIFDGSKLVAWLLTHDDGAMGFLHVLGGYRGRGYAHDLTYTMIKALRAKGQLPFVQIEESNAHSMGLSQKLGFRRDCIINWFQVKV